MKYKIQKSHITPIWTAAFALSLALSCPVALADGEFYFIEPVQVPIIKLKNPIYLDKSKTEKFTSDTSIPFNLRGQFDEADYFSSSAHDTPPAEPPPKLDFATLPSPSEYKKVNSIAQDRVEQPAVFTPKEEAKELFSPLESISGETVAAEMD